MSKYIKKNPTQKEAAAIKHRINTHIKYCSLQEFIRSLPQIRRDIADLLGDFTYSKNCIIATILGVIDACSFRIGKDEYYKKNRSTGASTLQNKNISFLIDKILISFLGKKQVRNACVLYDQEIINIISDLYQNNGDFIFKYKDDGVLKKVTYMDVNAFLNQYGDFTTKYYRTLKANVLFIDYLMETTVPSTKKEINTTYKAAVEFTASRLYHTSQICKKNYLDFNLIELYKNQTPQFYQLLETPLDTEEQPQLSRAERLYFQFISNYCTNLLK